MKSTVIDVLRFLLCRHLGIPAPYTKLFRESRPENWYGKVVEGDRFVPPTNVPTWSRWFNLLHWAWLAMFVWEKYAIFHVNNGSSPYHVMFRSDVYADPRDPRAWTVMPQKIRTRFVAMRIGHEPVEFATVNQSGTLIDMNFKNQIFRRREVLVMIRRYLVEELAKTENTADLGKVILNPRRYLTIL